MAIESSIKLSFEGIYLSDDDFYKFCRQNEYRFERDSQGNIYIIPFSGGKKGIANAKLSGLLGLWNRYGNLGVLFSSSTAFKLPSTSVRSPDVAWIINERWEALSAIQQEKFPPLCPDFVIELMSASDNEADVQKKMTDEWMANGCRLAWLINPFEQKVWIYRANQKVEQTDFSKPLLGEDILPNFELNLDFLK